MIIGIGSDIVDIRRIDRSLKMFGRRFVDRVFTEREREIAESRHAPAATYARRFAAKEACAKALGTGIDSGVYWRDLGVVNDDSGRPGLQLTGGALKRLQAITPPGRTPVIHLALTDDHPMAQATVIIEARRTA